MENNKGIGPLELSRAFNTQTNIEDMNDYTRLYEDVLNK